MRRFWLALALTAAACSSFDGEPAVEVTPAPDDAGVTTSDGGAPFVDGAVPSPDAAKLPFCNDTVPSFFCNDFELGANDSEKLYVSPSRPTGTNPAPGTISLIANAGGHAASIAIAPTDAGPREQYIALDPIMSTDHLSCTLDLWVEGAPTAEEFDVFRFFTAKSDAGPYPVGAKIVLVPQSVQNVFSVQLRYDTSSGFISLGTMSANVWKTVTLSLKADGKVSGSVAGAPVASTFDLGPDAFVTGVAVGIHRKEAAEIWVDNFRCVQ